MEAMNPYADEPEAARKLIAACRRTAPACTIPEICIFTWRKAQQVQARRRRPIENPAGWLINAVPRCFEGDYKSRLIQASPPELTPDLKRWVDDISRLAPILRAMRERHRRL